MSYQAEVAGWHDFYILAGTASATLVGLLFVGLSLHLQIVDAARARGAALWLERGRLSRHHRRRRAPPRSASTAAFAFLLISTVGLLVVSLRNTWDLLVTVADVTQ